MSKDEHPSSRDAHNQQSNPTGLHPSDQRRRETRDAPKVMTHHEREREELVREVDRAHEERNQHHHGGHAGEGKGIGDTGRPFAGRRK